MRLQLALNVRNLDEAIDFYSKMFDAEPARTRPGYANFAIAEPPLKLVLFEHPDGADDAQFAHLNHLGVEVERSEQVTDAEQRLTRSGIDTTGVDDTVCCYAEKTETWVTSPEGARWEWYVRHGDAEQMHNTVLDTPLDTVLDTGDDLGANASSGTCCS